MATGGKDESGSETLREDLDRLREDLAALSKSMRQIIGEAGDDGASAVRATMHRAKAKVEAGTDALENTIVQRPLVSMLLALVVGMVIGKLLDRR